MWALHRNYAHLQILINIANDVYRATSAWAVPFFTVVGSSMANCTITLALRSSLVNLTGYAILLAYSLVAITIVYFLFTLHETIYESSCILLRMWYPTNPLVPKGKWRRSQKLRDRRPNRHWKRRPLAVDIGIFYRAEHGCAMDFLLMVVNQTFDNLVLFHYTNIHRAK